jgi:hypothetical protein
VIRQSGKRPVDPLGGGRSALPAARPAADAVSQEGSFMVTASKAAQGTERAVRRTSNGILLVVAMEVVAGVVLAASTNVEGPFGGVLLAGVYALPLACVALLLRSSQTALRVGGGVLGGLFALMFLALPVVNGAAGGAAYTQGELVRSIVVTVPAAIAGLAALWVAVLRRPRRR